MSNCGPGVIWSAMPIEMIMQGTEPEAAPWVEIQIGSGVVLVEPGGDGTGTVVRLISTNPRDYLDPRFQPGTRLRIS